MDIRRLTTVGMVSVGIVLGASGTVAGDAESSPGAAPATAYQDAWGPATGASIPAIAAKDQHGAERDLASLSGANGLLLVVSRSAVW